MVLGTVIGMAAVLAAGTEEIPTGFEQIAKITPTSSATGGHLGNSVDIYENILIVGAPYQGGSSTGPGYAQWAEFSQFDGSISDPFPLSASDGVDGDLFGMRVAIGAVEGSTGEGGVAYVSAPGRGGDCASSCGAVYVFSGDGESEIDILTPGDGDALRAFGFDLSFDGASLAVGAPYDSEAGEAGEALHGAVYVYTLGPDGVPTYFQPTRSVWCVTLPRRINSLDGRSRSMEIGWRSARSRALGGLVPCTSSIASPMTRGVRPMRWLRREALTVIGSEPMLRLSTMC